jgi:hypothetical protein
MMVLFLRVRYALCSILTRIRREQAFQRLVRFKSLQTRFESIGIVQNSFFFFPAKAERLWQIFGKRCKDLFAATVAIPYETDGMIAIQCGCSAMECLLSSLTRFRKVKWSEETGNCGFGILNSDVCRFGRRFWQWTVGGII